MSLPPRWEVDQYIGRPHGRHTAIEALIHWASEPDHGDHRIRPFLDGSEVPASTVARALRHGDWDGTGYAELEQILIERPEFLVTAVDSRRFTRRSTP